MYLTSVTIQIKIQNNKNKSQSFQLVLFTPKLQTVFKTAETAGKI